MLAMIVNDNACSLVKRCAYASIASGLAPTVARFRFLLARRP